VVFLYRDTADVRPFEAVAEGLVEVVDDLGYFFSSCSAIPEHEEG